MNLERLSQPLDVSRIKTREGGSGVKLSYLETHDVIRTANDIFGYGGWGHRIIELRPLKEVTVHNTKYDPPKAGVCVGYLCLVELSVYVVEGNGVTSGIGYGDATEYRESAAVTAHELAAKEAESDALKRALKNYGDQFGLALYSKTAASDGHLSKGSPRETSQAVFTPASGVFVFGSGKYEGKTLSETPSNYLDWYMESGPKQEVKDAIITFRALEAPDAAYDAARAADDDIPFMPTIDGFR